MSETNNDIKMHYFLFVVEGIFNGGTTTCNIFRKSDSKLITRPFIDDVMRIAKEHKPESNVAILGIFHLGYMTDETYIEGVSQ